MRREQQQVREFMLLAEQECPAMPMAKPPLDIMHLRVKLITEELGELRLAVNSSFVLSDDEMLTQVADALGDLLYVVLGSAVAWGIDIEPVFEAIHLSNMRKFGPGSRIRADGKLLKSPDWVPPDIRSIVAAQLE